MAPISYYYFLSIIFAVLVLLSIINLIYLRRAGRTTFGQVYPVDSPDHKSIVEKLANKRNLTIAIIVELFLLANLIWSTIMVLSVNTPDAYFILVFAPIATVGLLVFSTVKLRKEYKINPSGKEIYKKTSRKHGKDKDGSWLS